MKTPYLVGLVLSLTVGAASIAIETVFARYLGLGDFILASGFAEGLDHVGAGGLPPVAGLAIFFVAKALFAALVYSVAYLAAAKLRRGRLAVSVSVALVVSVAMSLGEAVVA